VAWSGGGPPCWLTLPSSSPSHSVILTVIPIIHCKLPGTAFKITLARARTRALISAYSLACTPAAAATAVTVVAHTCTHIRILTCMRLCSSGNSCNSGEGQQEVSTSTNVYEHGDHVAVYGQNSPAVVQVGDVWVWVVCGVRVCGVWVWVMCGCGCGWVWVWVWVYRCGRLRTMWLCTV